MLWVDDYITSSLAAALNAASGLERLSWIVPDGLRGLNVADVDAIARWLDGHGSVRTQT